MKIEKIKKLIELYYNGETSCDEELLLFNYFKGTEVAEELNDEKEIFLRLYEKDEIIVPSSLATNLNSLIDSLETSEEKKKRPTKVMFWAGVAASIAIVISAGIYLNTPTFKGNYSGITAEEQSSENNDHIVGQQFTEAEYIQAEDAMLLLAANFSKGMEQLDDVNDKLEEANHVLNGIFDGK